VQCRVLQPSGEMKVGLCSLTQLAEMSKKQMKNELTVKQLDQAVRSLSSNCGQFGLQHWQYLDQGATIKEYDNGEPTAEKFWQHMQKQDVVEPALKISHARSVNRIQKKLFGSYLHWAENRQDWSNLFQEKTRSFIPEMGYFPALEFATGTSKLRQKAGKHSFGEEVRIFPSKLFKEYDSANPVFAMAERLPAIFQAELSETLQMQQRGLFASHYDMYMQSEGCYTVLHCDKHPFSSTLTVMVGRKLVLVWKTDQLHYLVRKDQLQNVIDQLNSFNADCPFFKSQLQQHYDGPERIRPTVYDVRAGDTVYITAGVPHCVLTMENSGWYVLLRLNWMCDDVLL
jgi:hypothetical protein